MFSVFVFCIEALGKLAGWSSGAGSSSWEISPGETLGDTGATAVLPVEKNVTVVPWKACASFEFAMGVTGRFGLLVKPTEISLTGRNTACPFSIPICAACQNGERNL